MSGIVKEFPDQSTAPTQRHRRDQAGKQVSPPRVIAEPRAHPALDAPL